MAKTKSDKVAKATKPSKDAQVKAISSVKEGAVTKPSQTPKSKSKDLAKQVAVKAEKGNKKSKKAKKEPTPEPSSDGSDSDEEMDSDSSASSDSEAAAEKPAAKANGVAKSAAKTNGASKKAAKDESESSESSESSKDAPEPISPRAALAAAKGITLGKKADSDDDSDEDSDDDSEDDSEESDDDEELPAKGAVNAKALNGALTKVADKEGSSDSESDGSEDDSDASDDSEDDVDAKVEAAPKKRKAETDAEPAAKKSKIRDAGAAPASGNLFVGNLSWNVDEDWLTREFEKFGELSGVRIITDKATGRSKGFGYVEFTSAADAAKAQKEMHEAMVDNRALNVDFAVPRSNDTNGFKDRANDRAKSFGDQTSPPSATLFIGNISFEATEDIISQEFGQHGTVTGVRLPTDMESGQLKGFGYVEFASVEEATEAFNNMKGASICDRPIRVDYSTPRSNTGDSPRGGRGGRGGGRGFDRGGRGGGRGRGGDRGGRGRGGFNDRGGSRGGRGGSTNRGGFGDFQGKKMTF